MKVAEPGERVTLSPDGLMHFAGARKMPGDGVLAKNLSTGSVLVILDGNRTPTRYAGKFWMRVAPIKRKRPEVTVNMSPPALRVFAKKWMLAGFAASGRGMNGDTMSVTRHRALASILDSYFDKIYAEDA